MKKKTSSSSIIASTTTFPNAIGPGTTRIVGSHVTNGLKKSSSTSSHSSTTTTKSSSSSSSSSSSFQQSSTSLSTTTTTTASTTNITSSLSSTNSASKISKRIISEFDSNYSNIEGVLKISNRDIEWVQKQNPFGPNSVRICVQFRQIEDIKVSKTQPRLKLDAKIYSERKNSTITKTTASTPSNTLTTNHVAATETGTGNIETRTVSTANNTTGNAGFVIMSYVFQFASIEQRDECKEEIFKWKKTQQLQATEEMKAKARILGKNPKLAESYQELVKDKKIISDEEFWKGRESLLQSEIILLTQNIGVRNSLMEDIRNYINMGMVTPNPQFVNKIFLVYPSVKKTYESNVPHKLDEDTFWKKFITTFLFHEQHADHMYQKRAPSDMFSNLDIAPQEGSVRKYVDLSKDDDKAENYGIRPDEMVAPSKFGPSPILEKCNRESSIILQGTRKPEKPLPHVSSTSSIKRTLSSTSMDIEDDQSVEIEDETLDDKLERNRTLSQEEMISKKNEQYVELKIQDKQRYFEAHSKDNSPAISSIKKSQDSEYPIEEILNAFKEEINIYKPDLSSAIIPVEIAIRINNEISRQSSELAENAFSLLRMNEANVIPKDFLERLNTVFSRSNELLRHFWSIVKNPPPKMTSNKLDVIIGFLRNYNDILKKLQNEYKNDHKLLNLIKPLIQRIELAEEACNSLSERTAKPPMKNVPTKTSETIVTKTSTFISPNNSNTTTNGPQATTMKSLTIETSSHQSDHNHRTSHQKQTKIQFQIGSTKSPVATPLSFSLSRTPTPSSPKKNAMDLTDDSNDMDEEARSFFG